MTGQRSHGRKWLSAKQLSALLVALAIVGSSAQGQERKALPRPISVTSISVDESAMVREAFVRAFGKAPAMTPTQAASQRRGLTMTVAAAEKAVAEPTNRERRRVLVQSVVNGGADSSIAGTHILEILVIAFQQSVREMNEDRKYLLSKMKTYNTLSESLEEHQRDLAEQSQQLASKQQGPTTGRGATIPSTVIVVDPLALTGLESGKRRAKLCDPCLTRRSANLSAAELEEERSRTAALLRQVDTKRRELLARQRDMDRHSAAVIELFADVLKEVNVRTNGAVERSLHRRD